MCGIAPRHVRRLCDGGLEGGNGYTPDQVANMTLDQVYFLLCERDNLRAGARRVREYSSFHAINVSDGGNFKGITEDGKKIERKVEGKSLARKLMERKAERELKEAQARDAANLAKKKRKTKT